MVTENVKLSDILRRRISVYQRK